MQTDERVTVQGTQPILIKIVSSRILRKSARGVKKAKMIAAIIIKRLSIFLICGFVVLPAAQCLSAVIVYDNVTTVGTPVFLKVYTKGRIFADGGRLVEFFLDNNSFGKNLTGGDG